ncbi:MAG: zinc ribbon domain-containing protein [Candidatus Tectomicrobia bacterium]|uniref:Zinc ribbon domain-containing protein n=1 Tax=Tectimicrobiota bacterium TaxID=2528274 RepID=A0A932MNG2_UNCTE|nr:zinc ribbon domain-containing protein [Candidatus Tectomicrobia bacterium]
MPIYEFHCEPCGETFECIMQEAGKRVPCPGCGSDEVSRRVSAFAARTSVQRRGGVVDLSSGCCPCTRGGAGHFHAH